MNESPYERARRHASGIADVSDALGISAARQSHNERHPFSYIGTDEVFKAHHELESAESQRMGIGVIRNLRDNLYRIYTPAAKDGSVHPDDARAGQWSAEENHKEFREARQHDRANGFSETSGWY